MKGGDGSGREKNLFLFAISFRKRQQLPLPDAPCKATAAGESITFHRVGGRTKISVEFKKKKQALCVHASLSVEGQTVVHTHGHWHAETHIHDIGRHVHIQASST